MDSSIMFRSLMPGAHENPSVDAPARTASQGITTAERRNIPSFENDAARCAIGRAIRAQLEYEFPSSGHVEHESLRGVTETGGRFDRRPVVHAMPVFRHVGVDAHGLGCGLPSSARADRYVHHKMPTNGYAVR